MDLEALGRLFYTGKSPFLVANTHFVRALIDASAHCAIHASEDIYDATGLKLWARGRAVDDHLLERLQNRKLRKPIELCVYAADPVATAAIGRAIESKIANCTALRGALESDLPRILRVVDAIIPSPTELLMLSVLRFGGGERMEHAALVCAIAVAAAAELDVHHDLMRTVARAALLHDIGELYLDEELFRASARFDLAQVRTLRSHPMLGAQVAVELAHSGNSVSHLIALSHERLDGSGYPRGVRGVALPDAAQALLFAEAVAPMLDAQGDALRRAAVAVRLIPGEFPARLVSWVARENQRSPGAETRGGGPVDAHVGALQRVHARLGQIAERLRKPARESGTLKDHAAQWLHEVDAMLHALRASGFEDVLRAGAGGARQGAVDAVEVDVLAEELLWRVRNLRLRAELLVEDDAEIGTDDAVIGMIESLKKCEPEAQCEPEAECEFEAESGPGGDAKPAPLPHL